MARFVTRNCLDCVRHRWDSQDKDPKVAAKASKKALACKTCGGLGVVNEIRGPGFRGNRE